MKNDNTLLPRSKYENFLFEFTDFVWEVDLNGVYTYVTGKVEEVLGYTVEEIIGRTPFDFMEPSEVDAISKVFTQITKQELPIKNLENWNISKRGKKICLLTNGKPLYDEDGNLSGYYGIDKDITEEKNLEYEIALKIKEREKEEQFLLQNSRMAQMGEMLSMIAHQWSQPISVISSSAINIRLQTELQVFETPKDKEKYTKYIVERMENIEELVTHLSTTLIDFRNFYNPNKQSVICTLQEVCEKSLSIIKPLLISNDIELIYDYNSQERFNLYDNEMIQVFLNIFKNALDVLKEKDIKNPQIKISTFDDSISIFDNGGNISEDIIDKIFDPYLSTKNEKDGTGLGLYMSRIIIQEHHKSELSVVNVNDGVCFIIKMNKLLNNNE